MASISKASLKRVRTHLLDEHVVIYLRDMNVVTAAPDGNEISITAMIEGYIIDIDEDFYYLGTPDGAITRVIPHELAGMVELAISEADQQMMAHGLPSEDEDVH